MKYFHFLTKECDGAGRLWKKGYGNGDLVTHGYDSESRLMSMGITNGASLVACYTYGWDAGGNILAITNNSTNIVLYGYDRAGQLTNEISFTNGLAGSTTNSWQYDEAGNWRNASASTKWLYNADNELVAKAPSSTPNVPSGITTTVTGEVESGPASNKWYNTWAECRGQQARVGTNSGTFSVSNVPVDQWGENILNVTVTDVSGNSSMRQRRLVREIAGAAESFKYDGNGNLTNWVCGTTNWVYQWDWADRMTKVTSNGVVVLENWYDVWGRRLTKAERNSTCMYLWAGWGTIAVCQTNGNLTESYSRSIGLSSTYDLGTLVSITSQFGSYYIHNNHRGDVNLIRSSAATVGVLEHDSFGTIKHLVGSNMSRFKFSSKEFDVSIQMFYFGSRYYAPRWQRWLSRERNGENKGLNLYRFVHNDPICAVDGNGDDDWGGYPWEGGIENGCTNTLDVVDDDNKRCAKVPPGKKSKKGCDYDFVKLPDGTWWKIGPGELDIGKDGKPCRGQIRHRKATEGEAKACEEALKDAAKKSRQN